MLDFSSLLKKESSESTSASDAGLISLQFSSSSEVTNLVDETFRFDGHSEPVAFPYKLKEISHIVEQKKAQLVIIDLRDCQNTLNECNQLASVLPSSVSVIILGSVNAISIVRDLKTLGFYYLFWPVDKIEFAEFVQSVIARHISTSDFMNRRRAKRIGLVGMRGGLGCSLLTAELGWMLSQDKHTSCLIVDHNYLSGNLDILLGVKTREKRHISDPENNGNIDQASAKAMVQKINNRLNYLALGLRDERSVDLYELNDLVISFLSTETNFVIDDLSASVGFDIRPQTIFTSLDVAVVVMEPTVTCLRETSIMLNKLHELMEESEKKTSFRIILVLNHHRAPRFNSVTQADIEKHLKHKVDISLPYEISIEEELLKGNYLYKGKTKFGAQLQRLCAKITGEDFASKKKSIFSLPLLRRK